MQCKCSKVDYKKTSLLSSKLDVVGYGISRKTVDNFVLCCGGLSVDKGYYYQYERNDVLEK
jgi:hypothetical protein